MQNSLVSITGKIGVGKDEVSNIFNFLSIRPEGTFLEFSLRRRVEKVIKGAFDIEKFAGPLKDCVCILLGCTREKLEDRKFKNTPLPKEWDVYEHDSGMLYSIKDKASFLRHLNKEAAMSGEPPFDEKDLFFFRRIMTPRKLLQILGTEAGRNIIHPDIWINALFSKFNPDTKDFNHSRWIITDTRFPNELSRVIEEGGLAIKVDRPLKLRISESIGKYGLQNEPSEKEILRVLEEKDEELYFSLTHESETALDSVKSWRVVINNDSTLENLFEESKKVYKAYINIYMN